MFTFRPAIRCVLIIFGLMPFAAAAQSLTVTLAGTNALCFGTSDGSITSTVTGGVPPYTYKWTTGDSTPDLNNVPAGYYNLKVTDAASAEKVEEITLTQPPSLRVNVIPFVYPNGKNISCYECYNGSIDVQVIDGTPPYSYSWDDGPTTQDRTGMGAGGCNVRVEDANGCYDKVDVDLEQPERNDWTMSGNAGTNPATQYIGTSDNKDVVFKSNGQERLRLGANGDISLLGGLVGEGVLVRGVDGKLRLAGDENLPTVPLNDCRQLSAYPFWYSRGNSFPDLCPQAQPKLGTLTALPLRVVTNGLERMHIAADGKVAMGPDPSAALVNALTVKSQETRTVLELRSDESTTSTSCELRFCEGDDQDNQRWGIGSDFSTNGGQDLYFYDAVEHTNRMVITGAGKVGIGVTPPSAGSTLYRLFVDQGIAARDIKVQAQGWPDYVFAPTYELRTLSELRQFLHTERHLPHIPSASEVEAAEGIELGAMQHNVVRTMEEQALYILQLEERIQRLEALISKQ